MAKPPPPIDDGEEVLVKVDGQSWTVTWHRPDSVPGGRAHGSAGICMTAEGEIVLCSAEGVRWDFPAGRPEGDEDWEQTLRREVREEACAIVRAARLLGFSRGRCIQGHEQGLVLVRAIWRADVELEPWEPRFEMRYRRVVSVTELFSHLTGEAYLRTYRRAMMEAGVR